MSLTPDASTAVDAAADAPEAGRRNGAGLDARLAADGDVINQISDNGPGE